MNTNNLKRFAQNARRKLMEQVAARLEYILTTDSPILREKARQIEELKKDLQQTGKAQLIEKVAYTWFNRLVALRFMDANDYQPSGIRVITPAEDFVLPQALNEAKQGHIPEEWKVNRQHIFDLLDGRIPSANAQNEVFRELLMAACNHLNTVFPFLFERIDDYTELLLPDDLTSQFSIIHDVVDGMADEDCSQVEVIGWLYQFYISEKKDEVFASKSKVKKEDIPAATQLFTPRWIVEYMVQNTVGKIWLMNRPNSRLKEHMPYYIEPAEPVTDYLNINSPKEITLLDQACGSGHIMVYGFELLYKIYEEEGFNPSEIPALIIENNLHGFEIDSRAAQLSGFALMMKAREHYRRVFRKELKPKILCLSDLTLNREETGHILKTAGISVSEEMEKDLELMQQATNFGSLIQPLTRTTTLEEAVVKTRKALETAGLFDQDGLEQLANALEQLAALSRKFTCVVDNPPYMGGGGMNQELSEFVKKYYPDEKADLLVCFMSRAYNQLVSNGILAMINLPSWMFLSSFEKYRKSLLESMQIETLLHLGRGIFGSDFGTVAFTFRKTNNITSKGVYRRLFKEHVQVRSIEKILNHFLDNKYGYYTANQTDFEKIPGSPIGYWISDIMANQFLTNKSLSNFTEVRVGLSTANNLRFILKWQEVEIKNFSKLGYSKWFPLNNGGSFRKWYGNREDVILWENNGQLIRSTGRATIRNSKYYYIPGLSWTSISSKAFNVRYFEEGFIFTTAGFCAFPKGNSIYDICAILNSKISSKILEMLSPTLNFNVGDISNIPIKLSSNNVIPKNCIEISQIDWDSRETSWEFKQNELPRLTKILTSHYPLPTTFHQYTSNWTSQFFRLHQNEEELNRIIINIYGLQDELTPDVPLEEITILQQELDRTALAKLNKKLKRDPGNRKVLNYDEIELTFDVKEVMSQLVSYAVGCMFGRYSLDMEGLILANQGETLQDYVLKTGISAPFNNHFMPDEDNIIPVLDEDWFEDDIAGRFRQFLKVAFGTEHFEENLAFVEQCLGKDIRTYFARDFYPDHIRRYKKRPIYWMFSSSRGAFNVLIYMHRYTPDTVSNILNGYLRQYQEKLRLRRQHLQHVQVTGTSAEKTQAIRESDRIDRILIELHEYERDILYPLAADRIPIDLDDGVLVNYNRFGKAIKEVAGLNDTATKKKVKAFDWVDTCNII